MADLRPASIPRHGRTGRAVLVVDDLAELAGPTSGVVELPLRLFWAPGRTFDLGDPAELAWLYATVLREATRWEDLRTWLDAGILARLWPDLRLPRQVRAAWQDRHPQLSALAVRPAA